VNNSDLFFQNLGLTGATEAPAMPDDAYKDGKLFSG